MTLPEFWAAHRGYARKQKADYWHTGHVIAALRNVNGGDKGKAVYPQHIFPFLLEPGERAPDAEEVWSFEAYEEVEVEDDG